MWLPLLLLACHGSDDKDVATPGPTDTTDTTDTDDTDTPGTTDTPPPDDSGTTPTIPSPAGWGDDLGDPVAWCAAQVPVVRPQDRFVAMTGADVAGCGSEADPCATPSFAWSQLTSGQGATIWLRGGEYGASGIDVHNRDARNDGAPGDPIVVSSYPGEWATFTADGGPMPFTLDHDDFVRFSCFEVSEFTSVGIWVITSTDIELDHLLVHGNRTADGGANPSGIQMNYDATRIHVHHDHVWDVQGDSTPHNHAGIMIFDDNGLGDMEIDHNLLWDVGSGVREKHSSAVAKPPIRFHHNAVVNADWGYGGGDSDLEITDNLALGVSTLYFDSSDGSQPGATLRHNTGIADVGVAVAAFTDADDPLTGTAIRATENVVVSAVHAVDLDPGVVSLDTFDRNAYDGGDFRWTSTWPDLASWQAATGQDSGSRSLGTGFVVPASVPDLASAIAAVTPALSGDDAAFVCAGGDDPAHPWIGAVACP